MSLVALLANPAAFDGKAVRVQGFLTLEFEGSAIYLDREAYRARLERNAIWVKVPRHAAIGEAARRRGPFYAEVDGVFHVQRPGYAPLYSGELSEVSLIHPIWTRDDYYRELRQEYSMWFWQMAPHHLILAALAALAALAMLAIVGFVRMRQRRWKA